MKKIRKSLSEDEYVLVRKTKKSQMTGLDEDQLIDLHSRIRRARNKYVTLYRRAGAQKEGQRRTGRSQGGERPQCGQGRGFREGAEPGQCTPGHRLPGSRP
ncbi:hypothetical protein GOAMI_30_00610 [Gordonia amicalis NBRC 100051 = JCM 11271]|nr:hypothetical protein GOAMI_30_00610 [Gordonia amicalis NBRC 100051 = JCM 11271]